jgi:hypothetical protein
MHHFEFVYLLTEQLNDRFMQRNSIFVLVLVAIFVTAAGMKPIPQDDPKQPGKKTHIKVVTIKDGEKQVLDTVIENSDLKVMHLGKGNAFTWTTAGSGSSSDTVSEDIEIVKGDGKLTHVTVHKQGGEKGSVFIREMKTEGDSGRHVVVRVEKSGPDGENVFITRPGRGMRQRVIRGPLSPGVPVAYPGVRRVQHLSGRNVIDLSDPGIISYQKKKLSGGREKITIIRNEVKEEVNDVFNLKVSGPSGAIPMIDVPHVEKEIKVKEKNLSPMPIEKK